MAVKKQWYEIVAPKMFEERVIGETLASDPKYLMGRRIEVSLLELSRDYSRFYIKLLFQVANVEGTRAYTTLVGHDTMRERIYRMVQRRLRKVECIQDVTTADGRRIRMKTVFVLIRRVNTSIKGAAREKARELVAQFTKERTLDELMKAVIMGELQAFVKKECSKIYPVGNIEVRKSEVL